MFFGISYGEILVIVGVGALVFGKYPIRRTERR